jgi:hypothetical protein
MRKMNILAFDDFITGTSTVYTRPELNGTLGEHDLLAIQAVADQINTTGTLTVQIYHSADQINWKTKNATAEINAGTTTTGSTAVLVGSDGGTSPSLGYVKLGMTLATTTQAHVKIWVTGRDAS